MLRVVLFPRRGRVAHLCRVVVSRMGVGVSARPTSHQPFRVYLITTTNATWLVEAVSERHAAEVVASELLDHDVGLCDDMILSIVVAKPDVIQQLVTQNNVVVIRQQ